MRFDKLIQMVVIRRVSIIFIFIIFCASAFTQKRYNIWAFGNGSGLNFNTNPVSPFYSNSKGTTPPYYISSVCDSAGNLLLYTDGIKIWNSNNIVLKRFNDWWPWSKNVMPLIIPYVSNDSMYYLFGIDNLDDPKRFQNPDNTVPRYPDKFARSPWANNDWYATFTASLLYQLWRSKGNCRIYEKHKY